jgi:hypothetical protein
MNIGRIVLPEGVEVNRILKRFATAEGGPPIRTSSDSEKTPTPTFILQEAKAEYAKPR